MSHNNLEQAVTDLTEVFSEIKPFYERFFGKSS